MSAKRPFEILRRLLLLLALGQIVALATAASAFAARRVALVVGVSAYRSVPRLDNPANDARLMADTLSRLGFALVGGGARLDLDKPAFEAALQNFSDQVQGADVALFYYAGHGVQVGGRNFLVPVDANPAKEADVYLQMIDTAIVLRQMEGSGTKLNMVLLDACRNSPFGGRALRAAAGGLAQMQAPEGTLISYATQPGNVALDGADGDSPYTRALVETIARPGLGLFDAFNEVGLAVKRATGGAQQPWLASSPIEGAFYFAGARDGATAQASPIQPPKPDADSGRVAAAADPPAAAPTPAKPVKTASLDSADSPGRLADPEGAVGDCDRRAAAPLDPERPTGVAGLEFERLDPLVAIPACRAALGAQPNNPRLMFELARALSRSDPESPEALVLFHEAAAAGHAGAMNSLGLVYQSGRGVPRDGARAMAWFRMGAEAGNSAAMQQLGVAYRDGFGLPRAPVEALRWFRKAAEAGNAVAMINVGLAYANGAGVARDPTAAARWYLMAAEAGNVAGMDRIAAAYQRGLGVAADPAEAVRWYRSAAEAGNLFAMENLGKAYRTGFGVARDDAEADRWLQKARQ
jgi:uncharacterized caspase-like protein